MTAHEQTSSKPHQSLIVHYLERSERVVLAMIAIVLVVGGLALFRLVRLRKRT